VKKNHTVKKSIARTLLWKPRFLCFFTGNYLSLNQPTKTRWGEEIIRTLSLPLLIGFLLVACSAHGIVMKQQGQWQDLSGANVAVFPLIRRPVLSYPEEIRRTLGMELSQDLVASFMNVELPISLDEKSRFRSIAAAKFSSQPPLEARGIQLENGDWVRLRLPERPPDFSSSQPDLLLFIEEVKVSIMKESHAQDSERRLAYRVSANIDSNRPPAPVETAHFELIQNAVGVLYDYRAAKVITAGRVRSTTKITSHMPEFVLKASLDDLATALIEELVK